MISASPNFKLGPPGRSGSGAILIYVLWILVVISVLAFQLTSASRATTLNQSAFAQQLKQQMQIESAIQFATFKIISNQWQDKSFELNLNNQAIGIRIFNESGFISIYQTGDKSLKKIFESLGLDDTAVGDLEKAITREDKPWRFNSFLELRQFAGFDDEVIRQLIPLLSIYHEESINPTYSPVEVLMRLYRIDQFRVQKLAEAGDEVDTSGLRKEILESLFVQEMNLSEDLSFYYRVYIEIGGSLHRVFLKYNRQQKKYRVVLIDSSKIISDANAS